MTAKLLDFRKDIASLELIPAGGGVFEICVDGKNIYSKKATGEFPNEDAIVKQVKALV